MKDEAKDFWTTLRGKTVEFGHEDHNELFLRYVDNQIAVYMSKAQIEFLRSTEVIIADGTFKVAPRGIFQVIINLKY